MDIANIFLSHLLQVHNFLRWIIEQHIIILWCVCLVNKHTFIVQTVDQLVPVRM